MELQLDLFLVTIDDFLVPREVSGEMEDSLHENDPTDQIDLFEDDEEGGIALKEPALV